MTSKDAAASSSSLYGGPIIDAHVHYWDPHKTLHEVTPLVILLGWNAGLCNWTAMRLFPEQALHFFASPRYITKPHLPADYNKDVGTQQQYVKGIVHVEAAWTGKNPVDESKWLEGLDASGPGTIKAIVGHADLSANQENVKQVLKGHMEASSKVRGIRDILAWHDNLMVLNFADKPHISKSKAFRENFALLQEYNLTFETTCYSTQLDEMTELAQAFPEQKILVNHAGVPAGVAGLFAGKRAGVGENDEVCSLPQCVLQGLGLWYAGTWFWVRQSNGTADGRYTCGTTLATRFVLHSSLWCLTMHLWLQLSSQ